jgi:small subunit ribosomal protein S4
VVEIRERAKKQMRVKAALELAGQRQAVSWVDVDAKQMAGTYKAEAEIDELPAEFKVNLVVELYSK